jgi:multidrug efflux pump subunit AcrB/outer membrane protein TolC
MKRRSFIEVGMVHWRIVLTLCTALVTYGVISFVTMPRQEFPDFTIRQGLVVAVMPGATSQEVEEQVARPVEDYLFSFNEVNKKKTYSVSKEGQLVVFVELRDSIKGHDAPAFWAKLRHGLNELKAQKLPAQVLALVGNNDFGDTSAVLFALVADGRSPRDLAKYMEVLQSHLRLIDATAKLRTYGVQDETIRVTVSRDQLAHYGIGPTTLLASLQGLGLSPAPARLDTEELELPVHVGKVLHSEAELGDTLLLTLPTGAQVRLRDVAQIRREYAHDDASVRFNGKTALLLSIEMQSGNDITHFGDQIDTALRATERELPPGVTIARVADQPRVVKNSVGHFLHDFGLAIASVILVTMLLLPLRVATVAAISIPVCIAITLGILNAMGVQLQTVSLAGLVVVLGMVVDNAIVVIDDHIERLDHGTDPWTAAWQSAKGLTLPVLTATVAIILSYYPMPMFLTGTASDFIGSLPVTIAVALTASMVVAVTLIPVMNSVFIRKGLHRQAGKRSFLDRVQSVFDRQLERAFRHPWLTLAVGLVSVVAALLVAAKIPQQTFPKVDRNQFAVEVYLPNGRSLKETDTVIRDIEKQLLADKRVVNVTSFIGQSSPRFHTLYAPHIPERNYGQLLVNTTDDEATLSVLRDAEKHFTGVYPQGWVRWKQLEMKVGNSVEVRISGDDIQTLKRVGARVEAFLRTVPGTTWVRNDYEDARQGIDVIADSDACTRLGVPPALLQTSLAMGTQGLPVATLWEGDYPVRVMLKDEPEATTRIEGIRQQYVSSLFAGASVPLEQVAKVQPSWSEGAIVRRNGVRTLTVNVDTAMDAFASDVQRQTETFIQELQASGKSEGTRIEFGGEKELSGEVFVPMGISMGVSIGLIFLVLLFQFQRFRKVLVVMMSMPLTLLGAFLGLKLLHYPFGLTAFVGVIGLLGIVIRNGVILVSYAEELRIHENMSAFDAALAAGKRRMRPIALTSIAAAVGVVPMILSKSLLWGPLGTVTCFGLLFGMVLTLMVLPVAYWLIMRNQSRNELPQGATTAAAAVTGALVLMAGLAFPATARADEPSYSLEDCQTLALKNNANVQESALEIEAAHETKAAAYTKYFPKVSAMAAGMLAKNPLVKIQTQGGNLPVYDGDPATLATATQFAYMPPTTMSAGDRALMLTVAAVQPVYVGGRIRNGNRLAEVGEQAAEQKAALARRDVKAETEEKYWRLVTLAEKLRTLESYQQLLAELDRQVSDGLAAGIVTRNDQLKVRLKRSESAVDRRRIDDGLRLASRDLRRHIGLPEADTIALAEGLAPPADPSALKQSEAGALARRPEMHLLESAVRAEHLQAAMKKGEMLPSLSVGASVYRADIEGMPGATNGLVFGVLSLPLSDIWTASHELAAQRAKESIARRRLDDTRELLALQIEKTWADLVAAWQASQVSESAVEQAEVNLAEETDRHANGLVSFSDLLEAQVLRQQALDRRIDMRSDYWLKRSAYLRAIAQGQ